MVKQKTQLISKEVKKKTLGTKQQQPMLAALIGSKIQAG